MSEFTKLFAGENISHISDADLDGVGCTILGLHYIESHCKSYSIVNTGDREMSEVPDSIFNPEVDIVFFTDIAPTLELANKIDEAGKQIIIVDHHETSKEILKDIDTTKHKYFYSDKVCASKLLHNLIIEDNRPNRVINRFVHLVDTYDSWRDDTEDWEEAKSLHYLKNQYINWARDRNRSDTIKNRDFIEAMLVKFERGKSFTFDYIERKKINAENIKEIKYYNKARKNLQKRVDSEGNNYLYMECPAKVSIIANRFLKEYNDFKYILCRSTYYAAVEDFAFSVRSMGDFDIRRIAESYGGGGHFNASGFKAKDKNEYNDLILGNKILI